jgi:hypothetical protein
LLTGCGRTELGLPESVEGGGGQGGAPVLPDECAVDTDCPATDACTRVFCAAQGSQMRLTCQTAPRDCDDGDQCTLDHCDATAGGCVHDRAVDADHDGFVGKAPAGLPASCGGPDCDDTDPSVYPGAPEFCDGKDNNCNGQIDEGAAYAPQSAPVLVAPGMSHSEIGDLVFDGSSFALTYTYANPSFHSQSYLESLNGSGRAIAGPSLVSEINADTYAGSLDFSGTSFLTAWADARQDNNYEIYLTRFDQQAQKLMPDRRLTNAPGFSLRPEVHFTGSEYVVIWEDHRFEGSGRGSAIFAHRLSEKGEPVGDEVVLTAPDEDADFASFDVSGDRLGVAYVVAGPPPPDGSEPPTSIRFRTFDLTLGEGTGPTDLGSNGQEPSVVAVNLGFVVAWAQGSEHGNWASSLQGATLDPRGEVLAVRAITAGDTHAKDRTLVSFGDEVLLIWSGTPTDADPFQLAYETLLAADLSLTVPPQSLAKSASGYDLTGPRAVIGTKGDIGVVYDESISYVGYFLRLACGTPGLR